MKERLREERDKLQALLSYIGLNLLGWGPGVTAIDADGNVLNFGPREWVIVEGLIKGAQTKKEVR
ncbi:MAG: hypothetical protein WC551_11295 [Patescibacteria group bacterium]